MDAGRFFIDWSQACLFWRCGVWQKFYLIYTVRVVYWERYPIRELQTLLCSRPIE